MRQVKRLMILLVLAGFVWPLAACEAPNMPQLPPEKEPDEEPEDEEDPEGEGVGFLYFLDGPAILA